MFKICRFALAAAALAAAFAACGQARVRIPTAKTPYDIGADFDRAEAWAQSGAAFVEAHEGNYFRFLEKGKTDAANAIHEGNVNFHGLDIYETRIWFGESSVTRIELSLYNKGDAGSPLQAAGLLEMLKTVRGRLNGDAARPPAPESVNVGNGVQQKTITWKDRAPAAAQLTWRYKKSGKEVDVDFVRLTLLNASAGQSALKSALAKKKESQGRGAVRKNVVRVTADGEGRKSGDVYISNVPMVDQGQKGYCAVATSERVLRYYGQTVDEHELGASAGSTADGGTSSVAMYEAVRAIGRKHGLAAYVVHGGMNKDIGDRVELLEKDVASYNKMAKKMRKPEIARSAYVRGHTFDANAAREAMEADVLKAMKLKSPKYKTFRKALHDQVNAGVPLFWGVTLGLFPEPDIPQASGGHMRLIIGFNDKSNEVIYTDSWGAGHEYKRMPFDDAWAITDTLLYLKPSRE